MRIAIGEPEFGEVYHAAAFVALEPAGLVSVIGNAPQWGPTRDFLNAISPGSAELCADRPSDAKSVGCTANVFFEHKSADVPHEVSDRILPLLADVPDVVVERTRAIVESLKGPACFLWVRNGSYEQERNLTAGAFSQLRNVLVELGLTPIAVGSPAPFVTAARDNLIAFYKEKPFAHNPLLQLQLLNHLCEKSAVRFSIGMKSGSMDGLAFARGLPTFYASNAKRNRRMNKVSKVFPAFSLVPLHYSDQFSEFSPAELADIRRRVS